MFAFLPDICGLDLPCRLQYAGQGHLCRYTYFYRYTALLVETAALL
jgi:hypothetical protein